MGMQLQIWFAQVRHVAAQLQRRLRTINRLCIAKSYMDPARPREVDVEENPLSTQSEHLAIFWLSFVCVRHYASVLLYT